MRRIQHEYSSRNDVIVIKCTVRATEIKKISQQVVCVVLVFHACQRPHCALYLPRENMNESTFSFTTLGGKCCVVSCARARTLCDDCCMPPCITQPSAAAAAYAACARKYYTRAVAVMILPTFTHRRSSSSSWGRHWHQPHRFCEVEAVTLHSPMRQDMKREEINRRNSVQSVTHHRLSLWGQWCID